MESQTAAITFSSEMKFTAECREWLARPVER